MVSFHKFYIHLSILSKNFHIIGIGNIFNDLDQKLRSLYAHHPPFWPNRLESRSVVGNAYSEFDDKKVGKCNQNDRFGFYSGPLNVSAFTNDFLKKFNKKLKLEYN